jgi:hypothetical protein
MNPEWLKPLSEQLHILKKYEFLKININLLHMRTIDIHTRKRAIFVAGNSDSIKYIYAFSAPSLVSGLLIFLIQPISGRKKKAFNLG